MMHKVSRGLRESYKLGAIKTHDILHHFDDSGTNVLVVGQKGSGKTTLLLTIADAVMSKDPTTGAIRKETVIWRGRETDTWNWIPKDRVIVFVHGKDFKTVRFYDDTKREIPKSELPTIERYTSFKDLYGKLKMGMIHVVYEPSTYDISENIKRLVSRRGMPNEDMFKNISSVDPVIFWFEFVYFLVSRKNERFISIIIDEFDEVCPSQPSAVRWHLNLWFRDVIKDLRKKKISLYVAVHSTKDFDGRLITKFPNKLYMRGGITPEGSLVNHTAPVMLETGHYYIENAGWGISKCKKIIGNTVIKVQLHPEKLNEFWDEEWVDDEEISSSTTTPLEPPQIAPRGLVAVNGYNLVRAEK